MKDVVAYVRASHGTSERRACKLTRQHRSTQRKPVTRDPGMALRQRMRARESATAIGGCTSC
jgi:putative transposase